MTPEPLVLPPEQRPTIYVSGASSEWPLVQGYIRKLEKLGFHVTHDWTAQVEQAGRELRRAEDFSHEERMVLASGDLKGVLSARVFWLIAPKSATTGAWVELGAALASGKTIVISGGSWPCIFTDLAPLRFNSHDEALHHLCALHSRRRKLKR
jgi:hypothetical protein